MLDHLGFGELILLIIAGIVIVGPDRLPKLLADFGRMFRQLRRMANDATADLREGIGVDDLASLHPRALAREFLLTDDDEEDSAMARVPQRRLAPGERPPYDPDAT